MKKTTLLTIFVLMTTLLWAQNTSLSSVMPLLQATHRNQAQNQQVLRLFLTAKQPDLIFSTGASLVRIPPTRAAEAPLLNVIIKNSDMLKQVFAAVILTAMGTQHTELLDLLKEGTTSADPAVKAYAAAAYTILTPQDTSYTDEIINLYIYDPFFAQRAMNLVAATPKQHLSYLKTAAKSSQAQVRAAAVAWLGDLQTQEAAKTLLKLAKTETQTEVITALAQALAKNGTWTLADAVKGLKTKHTAANAATYALALGFMTGNSISSLRDALTNKDVNMRINSARAAAYMAGVLASDQASRYTTDRAFDIQLLKGLIPLLNAISQTDTPQAKPYAQNALKQIAKLN